VYGEDVVNERTYRKWFVKFVGNFDLDNALGLRWPVEEVDNTIQTLIKNNLHYLIRVILEILKILQTAVVKYLNA